MKTMFSVLPAGRQVRSVSLSFVETAAKHILLLCSMVIALFVGQSNADAVSDWNATTVAVQLRVPNLSKGLVDLTYLHIAIYDAVNAINPAHQVFAVDPPNKVPWANLEAAVHSAARRVLMRFYAADSVYIDSVYQSRMMLLPNDSTTTKGAEIGNTTAEMYLSLRAGDGREANIPYIWQPLGPGVYQPTPPGSPQYVPVSPWQAHLLPFSFDSSSQYRAPAPPLLTSAAYTTDFNEVKMYGSLDSTNTTPEQREIARFHTENPGIFWPRNIRDFASSQSFSLSESARFFAQIFVSIGDALISGWNSKYFYNSWRPSTAIRNADIDGNPSTEGDTLWQPLVATPRHPEYPAAHGVASGTIAYTIERFFDTQNIPITLTSTVTGTQHNFTNINDFIAEIANARVWGGMHFRFSCNEGVQIGQSVAYNVADQFFQVVPVELTSFTSLVNDNNVQLNWETATEINNRGFEIERSQMSKVKSQIWEKIGFVNGNGTTTEQQIYSFNDQNLSEGKYQYRLKQIDFDGSFEYSNTIEVDINLPNQYYLSQNYPNPFNPSTTIKYSIPTSEFVTLKVFDVLGNEVATLVNEEKPNGIYEVDFDAANLSSGIYFYTLKAGKYSDTKKLTLVK